MKAPSRALLCQWVKQCWGEISCETIRDSFKSCGITVATSGVEDELIHCFKEGQPCADGRSMLEEKSRKLLQRLEDGNNDIDPFEEDEEEDEEEAEDNEVMIDADLETPESNSDSDSSSNGSVQDCP